LLVPDIAGWRRERMPAPPADQRFEIVPDWVCEILSPATASKDREIKMAVYGRHDVPYAWLVDPREQRVEAYGNRDGTLDLLATVRGSADIVAPPFDAVAIPAPWA
jgi:Uma2 family endonuclease